MTETADKHEFSLNTPGQRTINRIEATIMRLLASHVQVRLEGTVPHGPVIIAARHYHPVYDAVALRLALGRRIHPMVALDWPHAEWQQELLGRLCTAARWPGVFRPDSIAGQNGVQRRRILRTALAHAKALLVQGAPVIVFPEGYPTIDPEGSHKAGPDDLLPFHTGAVRLARSVARAGMPVPLVPVGLQYRGRRIVVRSGPPVPLNQPDRHVIHALEQQVRVLSRLRAAPSPRVPLRA